MPFYENVFIGRQDITAAQVEALTEAFSALVKEKGGSVAKNEYWGLRALAFRIKKNRKGHYVLLNLDAPPAAVQELERNQRLNEDVLRYLTVRVEALEEGPSAMMQRREERGERGDRGDRGDRERFDRGDRGDRGGRRREGEAPPAEARGAPRGEGVEA